MAPATSLDDGHTGLQDAPVTPSCAAAVPRSDVLVLDKVTKSFPGAIALESVSLNVERGEVHALLGENGAGKSTLIKIVSGALAADSGTVQIDGRLFERPSPRAAQRLGVRVIHQERQIALDLSAGENVLLDRIPVSRCGLVGPRRIESAARAHLGSLGIDLDVSLPARSLSVAQHQLIELARAVSFDARLVIMDEPTASLQRDEVATLFTIVARLRQRGVAVLFISHHLDEVFAIADRVTVLRDGRVAGTRETAQSSAEELVSLIFGQAVSVARASVRGRDLVVLGGEAVVASHLCYRDLVKDVSVTVHAGEVVVLTGSVGSGASEVARLVAGALRPDAGSIAFPALSSPLRDRSQLARAGVAFLPANRKRDGLLLDRSVADNILLSTLVSTRSPVRLRRRERARARRVVEQLAVKARDVDDPVRTLSGGNQQKVILGRWLEVGSSVLVFDEPTAGVDIASKVDLYRRLLACAAQGSAVVLVSSDYEEIHAVADRVLVMRAGRLVGEIAGEDAVAARLVQLEIGA